MDTPVIGIPEQHKQTAANKKWQVPLTYTGAVRMLGGEPLPIPLNDDEQELRHLYDGIDGLLLAGGGDVAARCYGAQSSGKLTYVDEQRDRVELLLSRWALTDQLPIFAICRGIQVLNVAAGGTLIADIPSCVARALVHASDRRLPRDHIAHDVSVHSGSLLERALGREDGSSGQTLDVNSWHHQAVDRLAPGFVVTSLAPDGVIEAIELAHANGAFVLGVQWHPEEMVSGFPEMSSLFASFIAACKPSL